MDSEIPRVNKVGAVETKSFYHYPAFRSKTGHISRQKRKIQHIKKQINPDLYDLFQSSKSEKPKKTSESSSEITKKERELAINMLFIGVLVLYLITFFFIYMEF